VSSQIILIFIYQILTHQVKTLTSYVTEGISTFSLVTSIVKTLFSEGLYIVSLTLVQAGQRIFDTASAKDISFVGSQFILIIISKGLKPDL